jgi:hypothetical protein
MKESISAADAIKAFRTKPDVQTATRTKVKDKATGKERPAFEVKDVPMAAEHIMAASKYDDGRVVVVTIDGKRHEARAARGE